MIYYNTSKKQDKIKIVKYFDRKITSIAYYYI